MILLDMAVKVLSLPLYHKISFNKRKIIREEEKVEEQCFFLRLPKREAIAKAKWKKSEMGRRKKVL